jgi:hypothetical protein
MQMGGEELLKEGDKAKAVNDGGSVRVLGLLEYKDHSRVD